MNVNNECVAITGLKGSGKTTLLTALSIALAEEEGKTIYSNYKIKHKNCRFLNIYELITHSEKLENCIIAIDELHEYTDCRNSNSKQNRLIANFFLQSRHHLADIFYTTQFLSQVDVRIRNITDYKILISGMDVDIDDDDIDDVYELLIFDSLDDLLSEKTIYLGEYYKLFDTRERINPFIMSKEKLDKINEFLESDYEKKVNASLF
jgi:energy-coupling factor transporter ATP-binding protein EcfA2